VGRSSHPQQPHRLAPGADTLASGRCRRTHAACRSLLARCHRLISVPCGQRLAARGVYIAVDRQKIQLDCNRIYAFSKTRCDFPSVTTRFKILLCSIMQGVGSDHTSSPKRAPGNRAKLRAAPVMRRVCGFIRRLGHSRSITCGGWASSIAFSDWPLMPRQHDRLRQVGGSDPTRDAHSTRTPWSLPAQAGNAVRLFYRTRRFWVGGKVAPLANRL